MREISQSGLYPSNCRLLDAAEAGATGAGTGETNLLILGFESAHHPVDDRDADRAVEIAREHGGDAPARSRERLATTAAATVGRSMPGARRSSWRPTCATRSSPAACSRKPSRRAITWDRFEEFHASVIEAARKAVAEVSGVPAEGPGAPRVSCRFTHVYPDGAGPVLHGDGAGRRGGEVEQWDEIKAAVPRP